MERFLSAMLGLFICIAIYNTGYAQAKRKIIIPKECRTANYTCVLKKTDGVPFFCVRTARQRQQNSRKKVRIVTQRNCIRRYPVEYVEESQDQP